MENNPNIRIVEAYSSENEVGIQHVFVNNQLVQTACFKIENNEKIQCPPPEKWDKYFISFDLDNPETQLSLDVRDSETGEVTNKLYLGKKISPIDGVDLMIRASEEKQWEIITDPIKKMSEDGRERLKSFFNHSLHVKQKNIHVDLVAKAIEEILSEQVNQSPIQPSFFKNINQSDEFGIERFIFDRMYHLPDLIEGIELSHLGSIKYIAQSEKRDSSGNSIKFEHRFFASNDEEATKLFTDIATKQVGKWQKIFLACWLLGNEKGQFIYSCNLTELMQKAFPDRSAYFGGNEKAEFYGDLKSLEQTRFVFSKTIKTPKRKKGSIRSYNLCLISIPDEIREKSSDKYPERLTISLRPFDPEPHEEKIYHVGAPIKKRILELHADNTQLASWLQSRKAQNQKSTLIHIDRNFLVKLAGLQKTDSSNKTVANKLLLIKLSRLVETGVLIEVPCKIQETMCLRIR